VLVDVSEVLLLPGDEVPFVVLLLLLELEPPPAGEGLTMVVLLSAFAPGEAPGVAVSTRCSQDARSAALAMMQIYLIIVC
jgi:hypothetical protein